MAWGHTTRASSSKKENPGSAIHFVVIILLETVGRNAQISYMTNNQFFLVIQNGIFLVVVGKCPIWFSDHTKFTTATIPQWIERGLYYACDLQNAEGKLM